MLIVSLFRYFSLTWRKYCLQLMSSHITAAEILTIIYKYFWFAISVTLQRQILTPLFFKNFLAFKWYQSFGNKENRADAQPLQNQIYQFLCNAMCVSRSVILKIEQVFHVVSPQYIYVHMPIIIIMSYPYTLTFS